MHEELINAINQNIPVKMKIKDGKQFESILKICLSAGAKWTSGGPKEKDFSSVRSFFIGTRVKKQLGYSEDSAHEYFNGVSNKEYFPDLESFDPNKAKRLPIRWSSIWK